MASNEKNRYTHSNKRIYGRSGATTQARCLCCGWWFLRAIFVLVNMFMALTQKLLMLWIQVYTQWVSVCVHNLYTITTMADRAERAHIETNIHICILLPFPVLFCEANWTKWNTPRDEIRIEKFVLTLLLLLLFFRKRQLNEMCSSFLSRQTHTHTQVAVVVVVFFHSILVCTTIW